MDNTDPNALTQALVQALQASEGAQLSAADVAKTNQFGTITNSANHRGTLYSTAPATQQTQYLGSTYAPNVASIKSGSLSNQLNAWFSLTNTQRTIDAQNKAAGILNGINFDQFGAGA